MKTLLDEKILDKMEQMGGSFVKALSLAARHADPLNFQKIKDNFGEYWDEYKGFVERAATNTSVYDPYKDAVDMSGPTLDDRDR